ncbi:MAG: hypothetical protein ABGZ17_29570 [Planctomycetaceae bacterium]
MDAPDNLSEQIQSIIHNGIDVVNLELDPNNQVAKDADTPLFGPNSSLGSLGLVNLLLYVEESVEEKFGFELMLTDDAAIFDSDGPLGRLEDFVHSVTDQIRERLE